MGYFRELPDIEYQSPLPDKNSSRDYVRVKNLFRRVKLLDWISEISTVFYKYQVPDGIRPETLAETIYGSSSYDWILLLTAGIVNVQDQWPLSHQDLYEFASEKYGLDNMNDIHHYETKEVKDAQGRLILPAGQVVDSTFRIHPAYNSSSEDNYYLLKSPNETIKDTTVYDTGGDINPTMGITNFEYETKLNEEKRSIYILHPRYLQQFKNDMRVLMHYDKSSQYVNSKLIRTENTRLIGP